jgi:hypothetical protein
MRRLVKSMKTNKKKTADHSTALMGELIVSTSDLPKYASFFAVDKSCSEIRRMRIIYDNGWELSIIRGAFHLSDVDWGGGRGLFEIALFKAGHMRSDPIGYLTQEQVFSSIEKLRVGDLSDFYQLM